MLTQNKPNTRKIAKWKELIHIFRKEHSIFINGFNSPVKRYRLQLGLKKKKKIKLCVACHNYTSPTEIYRLKKKGWKMILHATGSWKPEGVDILISIKVDFKLKLLMRQRRVLYIGKGNNPPRKNIYIW